MVWEWQMHLLIIDDCGLRQVIGESVSICYCAREKERQKEMSAADHMTSLSRIGHHHG